MTVRSWRSELCLPDPVATQTRELIERIKAAFAPELPTGAILRERYGMSRATAYRYLERLQEEQEIAVSPRKGNTAHE